MKTIHPHTLPAAIAALGLLAPAAMAQSGTKTNTIPLLPAGWLNAYPTIVQAGTHPTLNWAINFPSVAKDWVNIESDGELEAKDNVVCEIRVIGVGVTTSTPGSTSSTPGTAQALISYNDGSYTPVFTGTNLDVNPNTVVWTTEIPKNQSIEFGGKSAIPGGWGPTYTCDNNNGNVVTLISGDTPPTTIPMHQSPALEEFMKPYLDPTGKVMINPMDVIVLIETTHTPSQKTNEGFDLQDVVLLVTFKPKFKSNNGHGNNIDGIDSSNPGNAPFINLDTDPNFDDEGSGGGAYPSNP